MKVKINILLLIFLLFPAVKIFAQDFHISQYNAVPVYKNPASTGMFNDSKYRVNTLMRSQWSAFAGKPYTTIFGSFDMPAGDRIGFGGYLLHNNAANGYNEQHFVFSSAYRISDPSADEHLLSVGLQVGLIYKGIKEELTFDSQYSNGGFNNTISSGENIEKHAKYLPEINFGIFYGMGDNQKLLNPFISASIFHITSPNESFTSETSKLPRRYFGNTGCIIRIDDGASLIPEVSVMYQGASYEHKASIAYRYDFDDSDKLALMMQMQYRVKDAIVAAFGLEYKEFTYRIGYDFNTSSLRQYSKSKGGVELGIQFKRDESRRRRSSSADIIF